jgi:hypothetical protein
MSGPLQNANVRMRLATYVFLVLGALPIIVYPVAIFAVVLPVAWRVGSQPNSPLSIYLFPLGTLMYPAIYLICAAFAHKRALRNEGVAACCWAVAPLDYLLLLAGLGFIIRG